MLSLYRTALELRRGLLGESFHWLPSEAGVLAFERAGGFRCIANLSASSVPLPSGLSQILTSSGATADLPPDTTVWLRPPD
jgi:alpha-glucosidase